ncbi:hypothetical protein ACHAWO_002515, partial [Cyclotella atomus]
MPAETRRTTLSRRQQATLDRLTQNQVLFFVNKNSLLAADVTVAQEVDDVVEGVSNDVPGSIDAAESVLFAGGLQIDTELISSDEHDAVQLRNSRQHDHQRISPPLHHGDTQGLSDF